MPADQVAIAFTADVAELQAGSRQASEVVASSVREMGAAADQGGGAFRRFSEVLSHHEKAQRSLYSVAREFQREQMQQGRAARFYANELASVIPVGTAAKGTLRDLFSVLIEGAAAGVGIGLAFEGIKFAVGLVSQEIQLQEERAKSLGLINTSIADATAAGWKRIGEAITAATAAQKAYQEQTLLFAPAVKAAKEELAKYEGSFKGLAYWFNVNDSYAEGLRARIEALSRAMAEQRNQADVMAAVAQEKAKAAQAGMADKVIAENQEKARKAATEERLRQAKMHDADVKARVERELQAEQDEAEGRAKIQLAAAKKEQELEDAIRKARIEADNKVFEEAYEKEQEQLEKRKEAFKAFAQQIGNTVADAIMESASPGEAIQSITKQLERQLLNAAVKFIVTKAAEAAAAAFVSQAAIPVVGPALGASQAAAAQAAVLGLLGSLPSAAGGFYRIPFDQPVYTHKDEQILPAAYAEGLRQLVEGGGRGGRGGGPTIQVLAMDSRDVGRALGDSASEVSEAYRKMRRANRGAW